MKANPATNRTVEGQDIFWPVTAMLLTQMVTVLLFLTIPVMATEIAPEFGVEARDIAVFMSGVFASAMFFSAASGSLIMRFGGIRANQIGMTVSACCLLLVLSGSMPLLLLAAVLVGLGYGPNTPSGSHILARVTPPKSRALVFSLKQSGAPLGGLLAGLLVPALVTNFGWRTAVVASTLIALAAVAAIQPLRARLDDDRDPGAPLTLSAPWDAIRIILRTARLRRLTLVAFCLTATQATLMSFLVIYLVQEIELAYALAGALFAMSQAAGAALRVTCGWLADRFIGARSMLVVLGIASALALISLIHLEPGMPLIVLAICTLISGALSFAWNGVFLAEVAASSGPTGVGAATGGTLFFLYGGLVVGPLVVSALIALTDGYAVPLGAIAACTLIASANLLREH